jgi:hypothetical protein
LNGPTPEADSRRLTGIAPPIACCRRHLDPRFRPLGPATDLLVPVTRLKSLSNV